MSNDASALVLAFRTSLEKQAAGSFKGPTPLSSQATVTPATPIVGAGSNANLKSQGSPAVSAPQKNLGTRMVDGIIGGGAKMVDKFTGKHNATNLYNAGQNYTDNVTGAGQDTTTTSYNPGVVAADAYNRFKSWGQTKNELGNVQSGLKSPDRDTQYGNDLQGYRALSGKTISSDPMGAIKTYNDYQKNPDAFKTNALTQLGSDPSVAKRFGAQQALAQANPERYNGQVKQEGHNLGMVKDTGDFLKNNWGKLLAGGGGALALYLLSQMGNKGGQPQQEQQQASFGPNQYTPQAYRSNAGDNI